MRQKLWIVALVLAAAVAGALIYERSTNRQSAAATQAVPVTTALAARRDVPVYLEGVGTIQAYRTVNIQSRVDGPLTQISFTEGQEVRAGDVLGQIDPRNYQAALDEAIAKRAQDQALLVGARSDVQRNAPLVEKNYVSPQAFDALRARASQLEAAVKGDDAAIEAARVLLDYTTIRSPIDGRAGIRQVDVGNILHAISLSSSTSGSGAEGSPGGKADVLVVITQLHPISVIFTLPQDQLLQVLKTSLGKGLDVAVFGRNGGDALDEGRLEVIDNQVDASTGTVRLKAVLPNRRNLLWPGEFVNARLLVDTRRQVVSVPTLAVQHGPGGDEVYVVKDDGTVDPRKVATGVVNGDTTEILQGVSDGETVVVAGQYRLRSGIKVAAHLAEATAAASPARQE